MKGRLTIAIVSLSLCVARIADWIYFSTRKENAGLEITELNLKYFQKLPAFLQPLFQNPVINTGFCILLLSTAGLLFTKEKKKIFFSLGILSFVLAFWLLFSLM